MLVIVKKCYDKITGENKEHHIIGSKRDFGCNDIATLQHIDGSLKCRRTSRVEAVAISQNLIKITTKNTTYELQPV